MSNLLSPLSSDCPAGGSRSKLRSPALNGARVKDDTLIHTAENAVNPKTQVGSAKRLSFVLTHDDHGGAERFWRDLAEAFQQKDYAIERITMYNLTGGTDWLPLHKKRVGVTGGLAILVKAITHFRARCTHATISALPAANIVSAVAGFLSGTRFRIISHHSPTSTYNPLMRWVDRMVGSTPIVSRIVCVSEGVKASLSQYPRAYRNKVVVIRNAITPALMEKLTAMKMARRPSAGDGPLRLVAVGRLAEQKNFETLIRAMALVDDVVLTIVGDGPDRAMLEDLADTSGVSTKIHFAGQLDHAEALTYLAAGEVFVQPSLYEGHSIALLEAAAVGLPLVVSDVPTQVEAVRLKDGTMCAEVFPVRNFAALAEVLQRLSQDRSRLRQLEESSSQLSEATSFAELATCYDSLLS